MEAESPRTNDGKDTSEDLPSIDSTKPQSNYTNAMALEDQHEWGEVFLKEHQDFIEQGCSTPKGYKGIGHHNLRSGGDFVGGGVAAAANAVASVGAGAAA